MKKNSKTFFVFLLSILIPITILLQSLEMKSTDFRLYKKFQLENKLADELNLAQDYLDEVNNDLISYIKYGEDAYLEKHFDEREILHMRDVYNLFELSNTVKNIFTTIVFVILIYASYKRSLDDILYKSLRGSFAFIALVLFITFIISLNFNKYFIIFHEIAFSNDLWLLDPEISLMINMLPLEFFIMMSKEILLNFMFWIIILSTAILANEKIFRKNRKGCISCNIPEAR